MGLIAAQLFKALQAIPTAQKRAFLRQCFEGQRIPVRVMRRADLLEFDGDQKGLTKRELAEPVIRRLVDGTGKEKGRAITQTAIETAMQLSGFMRGLEYL